ncbi:unnamed protein product [Cylindrotheca closterium]|uniref:Uncharacterized protein n=1 Tax=Cylindrotheca closterium TaxID=2856 RepID=A0AAD2PV15_9STRA|nr:unnamed protein product [Cylindrotheca closterium]
MATVRSWPFLALGASHFCKFNGKKKDTVGAVEIQQSANMEAASATKDHFLTGGDELWHGAPEFPRETSSRDATCPGPSALEKQELAAILMFVAQQKHNNTTG